MYFSIFHPLEKVVPHSEIYLVPLSLQYLQVLATGLTEPPRQWSMLHPHIAAPYQSGVVAGLFETRELPPPPTVTECGT